MIARRLLIAGGGAVFPYEPIELVAIAAEGDAGAWTEVLGPHAFHVDDDGGRTYIGWVTGVSNPNDIQVAAWTDAGVLEGPMTLKDHLTEGESTTEPDSHVAPAVIVRPDGHVLGAWCGHSGDEFHVKISDSAWDITDGFGSPITFSPLSGTYTYPQLAYLSGPDRLYLTFRRKTTGNAWLGMTYSDDGGATWAAGEEIYQVVTALNIYIEHACNGSRIDWVVTDGPPEAVGGYGLWHFYMDDAGDFYKTDGTLIASGFPTFALHPSDLTEIVATGGDSYPYAVSYTGDGRPVIACQSKNVDPVEIFEYRWSGLAWERHDITTSDPISPSILSVGGGCHVWDDSERFFTAKVVAGDLQMFEYTSADDGATWTGRQLTSGTDTPNSPVAVIDNGPELGALWFIGTLGGSDDFDYGLQGFA